MWLLGSCYGVLCYCPGHCCKVAKVLEIVSRELHLSRCFGLLIYYYVVAWVFQVITSILIDSG